MFCQLHIIARSAGGLGHLSHSILISSVNYIFCLAFSAEEGWEWPRQWAFDAQIPDLPALHARVARAKLLSAPRPSRGPRASLAFYAA